MYYLTIWEFTTNYFEKQKNIVIQRKIGRIFEK